MTPVHRARAFVFLFLPLAGSASGTPLDCAYWNTRGFFERADAALVRECLAAGYDPNQTRSHLINIFWPES